METYRIKLYVDRELTDWRDDIDKDEKNATIRVWIRRYAEKGHAVYVDVIPGKARKDYYEPEPVKHKKPEIKVPVVPEFIIRHEYAPDKPEPVKRYVRELEPQPDPPRKPIVRPPAVYSNQRLYDDL